MSLQVEEHRHPAPADGQDIRVYALSNTRGSSVTVASYGAIVLSLEVADRDGRLADVVLGHPALGGYLAGNRPYFGAVVGRYANRIARGELCIEGAKYALECNDGENHLHGGRLGFDRAIWTGTAFRTLDRVCVTLRYLSRDGEEGYPGNLAAEVTYALTEEDELVIDYAATTDRPTVCNLAHHGYFNLAAGRSPDVLDHLLALEADRFTPVGPGLIPTGELRPVSGTAMDFRVPTAIGARLRSGDAQLALAGGYDHNWVVRRTGPGLALAARLSDPATGRSMEVFTTEPGLQFYSGNFLDGTVLGKGGQAYGRHAGLCLETQHFPDSPHHPHFPSTVLRPGETYRSRTLYRFSS